MMTGLAEFLDWSTSDPSYSDHEHLIRTRWNSCTANKAGGITVKTLYKFLIDAGAANLIPARDTQSDFSDGISVNETISVERTANGLVKNTLKTALAIFGREIELGLAHDEFSHTNVFRAKNLPWDKYVGRELTDNTERLCRVMALEAFNVQLSKENTREALLAIAQMRRFNPVTEYLDSLEWDRNPRIDRLFVDYFGAENSEYNRAVSKIFMVAAVRRVKEPGIKFDTVPILEGPQGSGKSTGVAILAGDWFSDANLGDITKKDSVICKQGCWIVELPELNALSRNHVDEMKAYLSRRTDRIRIPFERGFSNFDRNSVFVGTSNRSDYLRDETGNRRFWPIVTTAIKLAELESDRDQLWAEACFLEKQGESIVLAEHLWPVAANIQNQRLAQSPWTDSIQDYLDNLDPGVDRISSNELLTRALNVEAGRQNQRDARELAKVMKSLGATYNRSINFSGKSRTGYYLPKPK